MKKEARRGKVDGGKSYIEKEETGEKVNEKRKRRELTG